MQKHKTNLYVVDRMRPHATMTSPQIAPYLSKAKPILLEGETGSGKEVWAKMYAENLGYEMKTVNCAGLPRDGAACCCWLFGAKKGSHSVAHRDLPGLIGDYVATPSKVVLFMDEITKMPRDAQGSLLRLLQFGEVQQYGGDARKLHPDGDVRIVLAGQPGTELIEDITHRCVPEHIEPLRNDPYGLLRMLVAAWWEKSDGEAMIHERDLWRLLSARWPGNRREFANWLEKGDGTFGRNDMLDEWVKADGNPVEYPTEHCKYLEKEYARWKGKGATRREFAKQYRNSYLVPFGSMENDHKYVMQSMFGTGKREAWNIRNELWSVKACSRLEYEAAGLTGEMMSGLEAPKVMPRGVFMPLWQVWNYEPPINGGGGPLEKHAAGSWYEVYDTWLACLEGRRADMVAAWGQARRDKYYERASRVVESGLQKKVAAGGTWDSVKKDLPTYVTEYAREGKPLVVTRMAGELGVTPRQMYRLGIKKIIQKVKCITSKA